MKGLAWEFASGGSFTTHTGHSDEDERYPRNWSELMNVVLVYGDDRKYRPGRRRMPGFRHFHLVLGVLRAGSIVMTNAVVSYLSC